MNSSEPGGVQGEVMGDQRRFFKVWISALTDPDLDNLPLEDGLSRWVRLGVYLAEHGRNGVMVLKPPAKALCTCLCTRDFAHTISVIEHLPNCTVTPVTIDGVTGYRIAYRNWLKYQSDYSLDRVRKHRELKRQASVTSVTGVQRDRRVEKSRVEESREKLKPLHTRRVRGDVLPDGFAEFWSEYPRKIGKPRALKAWLALHLDTDAFKAVLIGLSHWRAYWDHKVTPLDSIPYPSTWLNDRRWEAELGDTREDDYARFPREPPR